jgi:hypothetical protein
LPKSLPDTKGQNKIPLDGPGLLSVATQWVKAINDGKIPNMMDAYSQLCRNECQKFATESARQYKQVIEAIELPEKDVKVLEDKCQNQLLSTLISFEQ